MQAKGFTLLEVLVAGFILFMSLSTATIVFTASTKSSASATNSIKISGYTPFIRNDIKIALTGEDRKTSGNGHFMGLTYDWRAQITDSDKATAVFLEESAGFEQDTRTITLWSVDLTVFNGERAEDFHFLVTSWPK